MIDERDTLDMHNGLEDASRQAMLSALDRWSTRLFALSHDLHAHPELNFAEHHAHEVLSNLFESAGFTVERHAFGLETAFKAQAGTGSGPVVAILCEYDALPRIGHACGHNVIAAIGAGAAITAAETLAENGGQLVVLGTPAEEGGGGKVALIDAGAFDAVDAALMVHPADADLTRMHAIAVAQFMVEYRGYSAHAAAAPQDGKNALDAAVLGYMNVAALRQHIGNDERIHGIFTRGGDAANVVPDFAQMHWFVRSPTLATLEPLVARVHACFTAGAQATGCTVSITPVNCVYADMVDNPVLLDEYVSQGMALGRQVMAPDEAHRVVGSTDMGNVSHVVPAIHPMIRIAPKGVPIHTEEFARAAVSESADRAILDGSIMLASLASRCWSDPDFFDAVREAFDANPRLQTA